MIQLKNVTKEYKIKKNNVRALDHVSLELKETGFYLIRGKSGSGKTTLLNMIARFESPTEGEVICPYQKEKIGYVTQTIYPLEDFTLFQNLAILGYTDEKIEKVLDLVQLKEKKNNKVRFLSGGERQRLSIAMVILKDCKVFLLDEPTGNLDDENSIIIFDLLKSLSKDKLVIITSHQYEFSKKLVDYEIGIENGQVRNILCNEKKQEKFKNIDFLKESNSNHSSLNFKWQLKYLWGIFKTQLFTHLLSFMMIVLTLILSLFFLGIKNFNLESSLTKSLKQLDVDYLPLYQEEYSKYSEQSKVISSGNIFSERLEKLPYDSFPYVNNVSIDSFLKFDIYPTLVIVPDNYIMKEIQGENGVVITDFLETVFGLSDEISISFKTNNQQNIVIKQKITGIKDTNISNKEMKALYEDNDYRRDHQNELIYRYALIYVKESIFKEATYGYDVSLPSGFGYNDKPIKFYIDYKRTYSVYDDDIIIYGHAPVEKYDVLISKSLYNLLYNSEEFKEVDIDLRDLMDSKNKNLYYSYFNLYELTSKLHVVGVTEDAKEVVINLDFYNEIFKHLEHFQYDGYLIIKDNKSLKSLIKNLTKSDFKIKLCNYVYEYKKEMDSVFSSFGALLPLLLVITCLIILYTGYSQVKRKNREIVMFRSFGVSPYKIAIPFSLLETLKGVLAYFIAIPIAAILFKNISKSFAKNFFIFIPFTTYLFTFLICLLLILVGSILPFRNIYKREIGLSIKDCR